MSFLVIGVNYRTDEHAVEFVRSLNRYSLHDLSIVLVDNSEKRDFSSFFHRIREVNPRISCLAAPQNLGYFGGAQYGLKHYLTYDAIPDWVLVCNVDIEFDDPDFFDLLQYVASTDRLAVIAPRIWSVRWQRDLNPKMVHRPEKQRMLFYKTIFSQYYLQNAYELLSFCKTALKNVLKPFVRSEAHQRRVSETGHVTPIYAPHGSCIVFHKRYFVAGADLNYPVFLFGEEIFVAEAARRHGLIVGYYPDLSVLDKEHASTGIVRSRKIAGYMKDATNYISAKYFAEN